LAFEEAYRLICLYGILQVALRLLGDMKQVHYLQRRVKVV